MSDEQVIVVGAGPVGLWLAGELQLAGVSTLVLERAPERSPHAKALALHPRLLEILAMRGMEQPFLAAGRQVPSWHFGMLPDRVDFRSLDTPFPFMLALPQTRTEEFFHERALEVGARVLRGHEVTALAQDDTSVTLEIAGPSGNYTRTADFVVGCDGSRSVVRSAAGIEFPGTRATVFSVVADVTLDEPPEQLGSGWSNEGGTLIVVPIGGGRFRLAGYDAAQQEPGTEVTLDMVRDWSIRTAGTDFGLRDPLWLNRFGNATRNAATYRRGRVMVAGDAAHIHFPAGGVGLNAGVQDAMNLGWKLAAVLQNRAAPDLLDSYHAERHPVGAAIGASTLAQTALITATTPEGQALRAVVSQWIATQPELSLTLALEMTALGLAYPAADEHPLTGTRAPADAELFGLLRHGKPLLLNVSGEPLPTSSEFGAGLGIATHTHAGWKDVTAAIIRPDGHVWWATSDDDPDAAARQALGNLGVRF
ncbi:FAD-dependent monooxygenase [Amycolatopsis pithecellobii]|uniref:Monooxygenase n=1 Tax=Amycolatopsis pithecellobii TaxID=664692 RepID=A0A6N7Z4J3_9PSEU|nr:FAD-dependent monooxygenase [Amycolatopsis pithecellobii]MTD55230.1 monooxygenase [Amycolatopsis pithecellobii]